MTSLRYSRPKIRVALVVAAAMTAMVSATLWMILNVFHFAHTDLVSALSALVFFAFVSVAMVVRYLRNQVVLAVRPTGLYDARWRAETIAWQDIREIVVRRVESEYELDVYLWHRQKPGQTPGHESGKSQAGGQSGHQPDYVPDHIIELAPLEGDAASIIPAIGRHVSVRTDSPAGLGQFERLARAAA